jgi:hypothetical protein
MQTLYLLWCSRCKIHRFVVAPLRYIYNYNRLEEFSQKRANVVSQGEGEYTIKAPYKMNKPLQVRAHSRCSGSNPTFHFDADPDPDPITSFTKWPVQYWEGKPNFFFLSLIYNSASLHCFFIVASYTSFIIFNILDNVLKISGKSLVRFHIWLKWIWNPDPAKWCRFKLHIWKILSIEHASPDCWLVNLRYYLFTGTYVSMLLSVLMQI